MARATSQSEYSILGVDGRGEHTSRASERRLHDTSVHWVVAKILSENKIPQYNASHKVIKK